jgi:CRISPR system Cascade subunit CasC
MPTFYQAHKLFFLPPSNINRDDQNQPKTAFVGNTNRLRIASQSNKRAIRTSDVFADTLKGNLGVRTRRIGETIRNRLMKELGLDEKAAIKITRDVVHVFGKVPGRDAEDNGEGQEEGEVVEGAEDAAPAGTKKGKGKSKKGPTEEELSQVVINQLAFISPEEEEKAWQAALQLAQDPKAVFKPESILLAHDTAVDIALFGRMLAASPAYNRDGALQMSHAITTHEAAVEDDFYVAVDDLKGEDTSGAGFMGDAGFGSGLFYTYASINRDLLVANLGGNEKLADAGIAAFMEAFATVLPSGKQNSYAALSRATYLLVERGTQQPRSLSEAFAKAVTGNDLRGRSIERLSTYRSGIDRAYGQAWDADVIMDVEKDHSATMKDVVAFCRG